MSKKLINLELEKLNRQSVYCHFLKHKDLTKQTLVEDLQLSLPTVTKNVEALEFYDVIQKSGSQGNTGGRRAITYSLVRDAKIALGIDITRNHVTVVALDLTGSIIVSKRYRIPFEVSDTYYQRVANYLEEIIENANVDRTHILGVGIGVPALVDMDRKHIFFSKILELSSTVINDFAKYIPYRIDLFNDANAAAFTETWHNPDIKNSFYLMLSNNIGGAMIINGVVYNGDNQMSSEAGHITLVPNGRRCYCGQHGCADCYLAATNLSDLADENLQTFFDRLKFGEKTLLKVWDEYLNYLAATVNIIHVLLDCDVILGGYVGEYMAPYIDALRERTAKLNTFMNGADYLKLSSYEKDSIAAGAALNFIACFMESI